MMRPHIYEVMKELDGQSRILCYNSIMESLEKVDLVEVDKVEAACSGIKSGVKIMRTECPLPAFFEGYYGILIRSVSSLDGSVELSPTTPEKYAKMTRQSNFKYLRNTTKYYWELNNHLYFPDIDWPAVKIIGAPEDDISAYKCDSDEKCLPRQEQVCNIPDYIISRAENKLFQSLGIAPGQIPSDQNHDNNHVLR